MEVAELTSCAGENLAVGTPPTIAARFAAAVKGQLKGLHATLNEMPDNLPKARQAQIDETVIARAAAEALSVPFVESLSGLAPSHVFLSSVPIAFARQHHMLGLAGEAGEQELTVVICDIASWPQLQVISKLIGRRVRPILATKDEIERAVNLAYQQQNGQAEKVIQQLDEEALQQELLSAVTNEDLLNVASRDPVIKIVNLAIFDAIKRRASDVHIQPTEDALIVRFRVDGVLHDVLHPPKSLQEEIVSRIKVMGGMNIAERRLPQDGRATVEVGDRVVDLRIATLPTSFGERAVIRLLDKSARLYRLGELGMPPEIMTGFRSLIHRDHGIVLVTGPTGSGKSTTLYAALQEVNSQELNVLTLEDPVEYRLEGISQTQISERKGMTFASGLRNVLRQDPDIIMVGEIRDAETARMAIQSALTGHLVFSTLHTNDAAGAVSRMLDLGVEPYLLASSLLGVLAQRLIRRICPQCRQAVEPAADETQLFAANGHQEIEGLFVGRGCQECLNTGYRERMGIFELLTVTETIRELVLSRAKSSTIKGQAVADGMVTLRSCGLSWAAEGWTTLSEVTRITSCDDF